MLGSSGGSPNDSSSNRKKHIDHVRDARRRSSSASSLSSEEEYDMGRDHILVSTPRQPRDRPRKGNSGESSGQSKKKRSPGGSTASKEKERGERSTVPMPVRTVPPPAPELIAKAGRYPVRKPRIGLRVKVRFVEDGPRKKSHGQSSSSTTGLKTVNWYGGVIQEVMNEGRKIRICYDDETDELASYPDREIIIDDEGNGKHTKKKGRSKKYPDQRPKVFEHAEGSSMKSDDSFKSSKIILDERLSMTSYLKSGEGEPPQSQTRTENRSISPNPLNKKSPMDSNLFDGGKVKERSVEKIKDRDRERDRPRKEKKQTEGKSIHSPHVSSSSLNMVVKHSAASLLRDHVRGKDKKKKKKDRSDRQTTKKSEFHGSKKRERERERENELDARSSFEEGDAKTESEGRKRHRDDVHTPLGFAKKEKRISQSSIEGSDETERLEKNRLYIRTMSSNDLPTSAVESSVNYACSKTVAELSQVNSCQPLVPGNVKIRPDSARSELVQRENVKGNILSKPKIKIQLSDLSMKLELKKKERNSGESGMQLVKRGKDGKIISHSPRVKASNCGIAPFIDNEFPLRNVEFVKSSSKSTLSSPLEESDGRKEDNISSARLLTSSNSVLNMIPSAQSSSNEDLKRACERTMLKKVSEKVVSGQGVIGVDTKNESDFGVDDDADCEEEELSLNWVQCDSCQKWRLLPKFVDMDLLPEKWFCQLNKYDSKRDTCDAPEQDQEEIKRERILIRKEKIEAHKARMCDVLSMKENRPYLERKPSATKESPSLVKSPISPISDKRTPDKLETVDLMETRNEPVVPPPKRGPDSRFNEPAVPPPKRGPDGRFISPQSVERPSSFDVRNSRNGGGMFTMQDNKNANSISVDGGKSRNRNRSRSDRNRGKEREKEKEKVEDVQWVQCESCNKWRRLASHINVKDLPDSWYCNMNTWNPSVADCNVAEDTSEAEHHTVEYTILNGSGVRQTTNKLCYRHLVQGGRQISERARTAESIFVTYEIPGTDSKTVASLMYNVSSAFVPKGQNPKKLPLTDKNTPTLFNILRKSRMYDELNGTNIVSASDNDDYDEKESESLKNEQNARTSETVTACENILKDLVYHALGENTLTCDEILLEAQCRNWNNGEQFATVRALCNLQNVQKAIYDLIQERTVEGIEGKLLSGEKSIRYRRFTGEMSVLVKKCRSMKIAKPWKSGKNNGRRWRWDDNKNCTDLLKDVSNRKPENKS